MPPRGDTARISKKFIVLKNYNCRTTGLPYAEENMMTR